VTSTATKQPAKSAAKRPASKPAPSKGEAKVSTTSKAPARKPRAADRGVPAVYLGSKGRFLPGRDASLKRDLLAAVLGLSNPDALHTFTAKEALALLTERGWLRHLDVKRSALEAKAAREAKRQAAAKAAPKAKVSKAA
jgi:hypothetical protein